MIKKTSCVSITPIILCQQTNLNRSNHISCGFAIVLCQNFTNVTFKLPKTQLLTQTLCFLSALSPLLIMWRNWAIPTYGFRLLEDFIFPTTPQRWDCCLRTERHESVCITCSIIDMYFFFPPSSACTWGKLPERQSNGEHHEAAEGTTPVPPGLDQAVCLFRYVRCDRPPHLQRRFPMESIFQMTFVFAPAAEHSIIPVTSECQHLFPAKIMSRLARWTPITHEDYKV